MRPEDLIFSSLANNEDYARKVLPFIKEEYFQSMEDKAVYKLISEYITKYNTLPTKSVLLLQLGETNLSSTVHSSVSEYIEKMGKISCDSMEYLVEKSEQFCKERAIYNALMQAVQIADGKDKNLDRSAIPGILQSALAVTFDASVGHSYNTEYEQRYEHYHNKVNKLSTGIDILDKATKGGIPRKTLNVILAPPHGGKSLTMLAIALNMLRDGNNVLYITLEMAEEEIGKRADVNLMGVSFDQLALMPKGTFTSKFKKVLDQSMGRLVIKEYPTGAAHAGHFKALIDELRIKQNYVPDVIVVDYMNIMNSQKYKASSGANSYTIVKSVGEELRALAIETNTVLFTATQTTRSGANNSDVDITNTSESFGVPAIADFFLAVMDTEELRELNQLLFKQLKNRYADKNLMERFLVGIDRQHMTLYDIDQPSAKVTSNQTAPIIKSKISNDSTDSGSSDGFDGFKF